MFLKAKRLARGTLDQTRQLPVTNSQLPCLYYAVESVCCYELSNISRRAETPSMSSFWQFGENCRITRNATKSEEIIDFCYRGFVAMANAIFGLGGFQVDFISSSQLPTGVPGQRGTREYIPPSIPGHKSE